MPRTPGADPKAPDSQVPMRDFSGLATYADPHDITPGAGRVQVNVVSSRPGELRVRQGYKRVTFDS